MDGAFGEHVNEGYLAKQESKILRWMCVRMPKWVEPDHMTALSLFGALVVFCGYVASRFDPAMLWIASVGLFLNWCGDSLDGSLARFRNRPRMRYGYFLDCMTDVFCSLLIMVGVGLTFFVHMETALFALCGYFLICIFIFLNHHVNGIHRISLHGVGPTEMRVALIAMNSVMFFAGPLSIVHISVYRLSAYDLALIGDGLLSIAIFLGLMMHGVAELNEKDPVAGVHSVYRSQAN